MAFQALRDSPVVVAKLREFWEASYRHIMSSRYQLRSRQVLDMIKDDAGSLGKDSFLGLNVRLQKVYDGLMGELESRRPQGC